MILYPVHKYNTPDNTLRFRCDRSIYYIYFQLGMFHNIHDKIV